MSWQMPGQNRRYPEPRRRSHRKSRNRKRVHWTHRMTCLAWMDWTASETAVFSETMNRLQRKIAQKQTKRHRKKRLEKQKKRKRAEKKKGGFLQKLSLILFGEDEEEDELSADDENKKLLKELDAAGETVPVR